VKVVPDSFHGVFRDEELVIIALDDKHNAEDVCLKARPVELCQIL